MLLGGGNKQAQLVKRRLKTAKGDEKYFFKVKLRAWCGRKQHECHFMGLLRIRFSFKKYIYLVCIQIIIIYMHTRMY